MAVGPFKTLFSSLLLLCVAPVLCGSLGLTSNMETRILFAHNAARAKMGVPPLSWDPNLVTSAQQWADHLAAKQLFEHAPERLLGDEGENLWAGTSGYFPVDAMVDAWVREKRSFKPGLFPDNSVTGKVADVGHYTQLMWRRSRHVGCAIAKGAGEDVLVCRYSEAGNYIGETPF